MKLRKHLPALTMVFVILTFVITIIRINFFPTDFAPELIAGLTDGAYVSVNGREIRAVDNYLPGTAYSQIQLEELCPNDELSELGLRATPQSNGNILGSPLIVLMIDEAGERCIPLDEKDHIRDQLVFRAKDAGKTVALPDQPEPAYVQVFSVAQASNHTQRVLDLMIPLFSLITGAFAGALVGLWTDAEHKSDRQ